MATGPEVKGKVGFPDSRTLSDSEREEMEALRGLCRSTGQYRGRGRVKKRAMHAPEVLNEAYNYARPSSFSRGMRVEFGGVTFLFISGTASVDEEGKSVHVGDFQAQTWRTFRNITALLASEGATWHDVIRTTCFLRDIERDYRDFNEVRGDYWIEQDHDGGFQLKMLLNEKAAAEVGLWPDEDVTGGKELVWDYAFPYSLRGDPFKIDAPEPYAWNQPPYWIYHRIWMQGDLVKATSWSANIGDENIDMTTIASLTPGADVDVDGYHWVDPANGWAIVVQDPILGYFPSGYFAIGAWSGTSDWAWMKVETLPTAVENSTWGAVKSLFR